MRSGGSDRLHIVVNYMETLRNAGRVLDAVQLGRQQVTLHERGSLLPSPELVAVYVSLASSELGIMELDNAVAHLHAALRMDARSYAAIKQLVLTYQRMEQFKLAEQTSLQALQILGDDFYLHYLLATSLHYQKRIDEALALYLHVLRSQPAFHDVLGNIATAYQGLGQTKEAHAYYLQALPHAPEDATLRNNLGALLGSMGRKEEEVYWLNEALRLSPYMVQALMNLASEYIYPPLYALPGSLTPYPCRSLPGAGTAGHRQSVREPHHPCSDSPPGVRAFWHCASAAAASAHANHAVPRDQQLE